MEPWDVNKAYDRMGLENQTTEILGLNIPSLTIPVKPGRNLAVIIELCQKDLTHPNLHQVSSLQKLLYTDSMHLPKN